MKLPERSAYSPLMLALSCSSSPRIFLYRQLRTVTIYREREGGDSSSTIQNFWSLAYVVSLWGRGKSLGFLVRGRWHGGSVRPCQHPWPLLMLFVKINQREGKGKDAYPQNLYLRVRSFFLGMDFKSTWDAFSFNFLKKSAQQRKARQWTFKSKYILVWIRWGGIQSTI